MKKYFILSLIALLAVISFVFISYQRIFSPSVTSDYELKIPSGSSYDDLLKILEENDIVSDIGSFTIVSKWMKYGQSEIPTGRYMLKEGWNNKRLISKLRSGDQNPVRVTINNVRKLENLCAKFADKLEVDSLELLNEILDKKTLDAYNLTKEEALSLFISNTYEFWWNDSPTEIIERMAKENKAFWKSKDRLAKAKALKLSRSEVYTLASIVEKETQVNNEKQRIAGVYLNRLRRGMLLQADPTVIYANNNFGLKRVLNKHLKMDSPYNTYLYEGLPPGPIYMPGLKSLDAVLNAEKHSYLYFCAKPDNSGTHAFSPNLIGHNRNAQRYWAWLKKNKIR